MPSALAAMAASKALTIWLTSDVAEPTQSYEQLSRVQASWAP
jgi:hypothetical protein